MATPKPTEKANDKFCKGNARDNAVKAFSPNLATKILSMILRKDWLMSHIVIFLIHKVSFHKKSYSCLFINQKQVKAIALLKQIINLQEIGYKNNQLLST